MTDIIYTKPDVTIDSPLKNGATRKPTDVVRMTPSLKYTPATNNISATTSMSIKADRFIQTLSAEQMLVKHIVTGQTKSIDLTGKVIALNRNSKLAVSEKTVRDDAVAPKQNYTKIDETMVNIFSHKGPDEQSGIMPMPMSTKKV